MYTRAYPPREVPQNYSGVALLQENEMREEERFSEDLPPPEGEEASCTEKAQQDVQEEEPREKAEAPASPATFANTDMLLLLIAAFLSQSGDGDSDLLTILLLLLIGE
jgi:hypothetical protein